MSPGCAEPRDAIPRINSVVEPSVLVGCTMAATSACVNETFMG
jgi:hypothetical protein